MTALAGLWHFGNPAKAMEGCARILAGQEIYGSEGGAPWSGDDVAVGRRLTPVLPEDAFDRQPLVGGGGRFVLVADLRLDNREELIEALNLRVGEMRGDSDAAIFLAAFEHWGEACLRRIIGDYACAIWDRSARRLLLARDPLGYRPLHYHRGNGFFAFASMPRGLHALAEVTYAVDEDHIAEYLLLFPETGSRTFFRGIERVPPGHVVAVDEGQCTTRRHWDPDRRSIVLRGPAEYAEAARELLDKAVRCRLRGATTVGCFLSGGLDSSAVAATAARQLAPSSGRVVAFTAVPREGYDGPSQPGRIANEAPYAAATVAMYPNMEQVLVADPARSPLDDLDRCFLLFQRPSLNLAGAWSLSICDEARTRGLRVMLLGAFGNLGLSYSGAPLLPELFRSGRWIEWWRAARAVVARQGASWPHMAAETLGPWFPAPLWRWLNRARRGKSLDVSSYSPINPRRLAELRERADARSFDSALMGRPWSDSFFERLWSLEWADQGNQHAGTLAGWGIDRRDPTADIRLLEFCLAVPTEQFLRDGVPRALARTALADRLPKVVVEEWRRGEQGVDWHERLTAVRDRVSLELERLDRCPTAARTLDLGRLHRLVEVWPAGGWERGDIRGAYRSVLLAGIGAGHFLRRTAGVSR